MDASATVFTDLNYADSAPVLIAATTDAAAARARSTIEAAQWRIAGVFPITEARQRVQQQVSASAVWVEIDRDDGEPMDGLLRDIARDAGNGRYAAVVASAGDLIDPVISCLGDSPVQMVIDGDEPARIAALAVATADAGLPLRVSDIAADRNTERLRQLSDEVGRIAAALARLSTGPAPATPILQPVEIAEAGPVSADTVRAVIRARRLRSRFFSEELFADPAWDMLLDLLQAEISHLRVPVSSLCIAAAVPATTALRWLRTMVAQGLFLRSADPHDGRRVFVELAPETSNALRRYFAEVGPVIPI